MSSILIVDDSKSMRRLVAFALEDAGHQVVEAVGGDEALGTSRAATSIW